MTEPKIAGRLPVWDFFIHLMGKVLFVTISYFLLLVLAAIAFFFALRWAGFQLTSTYFGKFAFVAAMTVCFLQALQFNSKRMIRYLCARRRVNKMFLYPHPVVRDVRESDNLSERVRRFCAIAVIEAKAITIAFGVTFLLFYLSLLYFLDKYDQASLSCKNECEIGWYWIKSIGSGPLFDFFEAFHIQLSNLEDGSFLFRTTSYLAKIASTLLVVQTFCVYFGFRRRFRWALRTSALSLGDPESVVMLKNERSSLGPRGVYLLLPPWLRRNPQAKTARKPEDPTDGPLNIS
jgi:hypothetical protein